MPFKKGEPNPGAPKGNDNKRKGKPMADALRRYAAQNPEKLRSMAAALFAKAAEGDVQAAKEIGDRLDGKAVQAVEMEMEGRLKLDNKLNIILK